MKILKMFFLSIVLCFLCCVVDAESLDTDFYLNSGDNEYAGADYIFHLKDGGFVVTSNYLYDEIDLEDEHAGTAYFAVDKYSKDGVLEWHYVMPEDAPNIVDLEEDPEGNILILARGLYSGNYGNVLIKTFIFKITADGDFISSTQLDTGYTSLSLDTIYVNDDGSFYASGESYLWTYTGEDDAYYYFDVKREYAVYKFNKKYSLVWRAAYESDEYETETGKYAGGWVYTDIRRSNIDVTTSGDVVLSSKYGDESSFRTIRVNQNGDIIYDVQLHGKSFSDSHNMDVAEDVVATDDDGSIVVGSFCLNTIFSVCEGVYIKFDKEGNEEWRKVFKSTEAIYGIVKNEDSYVMLASTYWGDEEQYNIVGFTLKIDEKGKILSRRDLEHDLYPGFDALSCYDDNIYIAGAADASLENFPDVENFTNAIFVYNSNYDIILINDSDVNNVKVKDKAFEGDIVEVEIELNDDYILKEVLGATLKQEGDYTYSFVMPDKDVELIPIFQKKDAEIEDNEEGIKNPETSDVLYLAIVILLLSSVFFIVTYKRINAFKIKK